MKEVGDECWMCGTPINTGDEYVDVVLHRMHKRKKSLVHRACLKCARKNCMLSKDYYNSLVEDGIWR